MGFLAKGTSPQTRSRIKNEKTEDQMGFFNLILTKNIMNTRNKLIKHEFNFRPDYTKLKAWNHTQTSFKQGFGTTLSP
jgi:hypothetical protein